MTRQELIQELMQDSQAYCCYCGTPKVRFSCCGENHFETFAEMNKETQESILSDMAGEVSDFWEGYVPEPVKPAQQEPVGYVRTINGEPTPDNDGTVFSYGINAYQDTYGDEVWRPVVYTSPPAQQEPVQRYSPNGEGGMEIDSLGAWVKFIPPQPAQRTWVGLTDEEIDKTHETKVWDARRSYARAIEAKLKERNT